MLALRPNCECCDADLPPDSLQARICSFECTFCARCVQERLQGICPNCGGEFVRRPRRPAAKVAMRPASSRRVLRPCSGPGAGPMAAAVEGAGRAAHIASSG
jgi:hypothetical protein